MTAPDVDALFRLDGRVAVVTGASAGLGERFARVLHAAGASVVVAARRSDRLEALAAALGTRVAYRRCDVVLPEDRSALVDAAIEEFGAIDVLVNNAGIGTSMPAEDHPLDDFEHVLDVNLTALFHLCQLAGRRMLEAGGGSIVNIASIFGLVAALPVKHAAYVASKGGVVALTRELGAQWASRGVRVNALAPGWFESEMTEHMWQDERSLAYVERNAPAARHGMAHELDGALLFLASSASTYVHGQTIAVDGGWTAR